MDVKSSMDSYFDMKWIMFHGHLDCFQKPPLGGRPNRKPRDHGTPLTTVDLFHFIEGLVTSHYTQGSMKTLHEFGGVLGRPLDTFF